MCGYKDQPAAPQLVDKFRSYQAGARKRVEWEKLATANWDSESSTVANADKAPGVGGIGNYFFSHKTEGAESYLVDSTKFGPNLAMFPGKAPQPYYNSKIETLEKNYRQWQSGKKTPFARATTEALLYRPCVVFVERFFESQTLGSKGYFKVERADQGLIPLAGFLLPEMSKEGDFIAMGHTLITRDPYAAIQKMGHHRSPVVLRDEYLDAWLQVSDDNFNDRRDMVAAVDQSEYVFQEVERTAVTKRTPQARDSREGGTRIEGTLDSAA